MKKSKNSNRIKKQLGLSAAAIAGCALGGVDNASADIVTTYLNTVIDVPATFAGVYINLENGVTGGSAGATPGWDFNPYQTGSGVGFFWGGTPQGGGVATLGPPVAYTALNPGDVVGPASTFSAAIQGTADTPFRNGGQNYLGFRFTNGANVTNYGYMLFESTGGGAGNQAGFPARVLGWAYENSGAGIAVGAIPEPGVGALGVLAMGAIAARRRRQGA